MSVETARRNRRAASAAVAIEGLTKTYGEVRAVDGVSLTVERGEVVGLLGPNGAGKTTLIKCALGLLVPTAGAIRVGEVDVRSDTARAYREVSAMLEGARNVYWRLTVRENVRFFAGLQGIDPRTRRETHADLIASLGLAEQADTPVVDLSRGMKQKTALACTLARETPVVFLDEPTLGLDVEASLGLRQRIRRLADEEGRTIVLSSHDMDVVQEVCDRVVVLNDGRVVANGSVDDLVGAFRARAYRVTVSADLPLAARERLERAHRVERWSRTASGLRFEVTLDDAAAFYALVDDLRETDVDLVSVTAVEPDLEDAFLQLTDRVDR
ncbi:ABC transporter ATP-binding protein [Halomarina ordinaria]|uniref:ABC transporter ATP-binding protein n=1 Tax=Halomarina ordinaria TaxID=3033939 RepID=A0ABD5U759_9EURY|nr:ABC transporter ATP-binding protein [Halomarina sp. PSRA2]